MSETERRVDLAGKADLEARRPSVNELSTKKPNATLESTIGSRAVAAALIFSGPSVRGAVKR